MTLETRKGMGVVAVTRRCGWAGRLKLDKMDTRSRLRVLNEEIIDLKTGKITTVSFQY
jgi:hypothetical protein